MRAITERHQNLRFERTVVKGAIRLTELLLKHPLGNGPATSALATLMYLNAARLLARMDLSGNLAVFSDQDRSLWDQVLAKRGLKLLENSTEGSELTDYHIEAAIAWVHTSSHRAADTDWKTIISLYDNLMAIRRSPVVALNRAIAIGQRDGPHRGSEEIHAIQNLDRLAHYRFYHAALGEFALGNGQTEVARHHFESALAAARNPMERHFFEQRVVACK